MAAERIPDGYLFELYHSYIGEPDSDRDVYVGFGLFLTGVALAAAALGLFLWASTFDRADAAYFALTRPAYALGMLSLPAMMLGVVVLLPSERKVIWTSLAGAAVTAVATVGFALVYPSHWNFMGEVDYTVEVTATYAVGLAAITASTGAALIAHYLEMARRIEAIEAADEEEDEQEEHYTDEEIRRDVDEAMEGVELSWGGVEKTETTRLEFTAPEFEGTEIAANVGVKKTRSTGVDAQVAGLKGLKGGEAKTATSSTTVDEQTAKLRELREQQRAEELADASGGDASLAAGWLDRARSGVGAIRQRLSR